MSIPNTTLDFTHAFEQLQTAIIITDKHLHINYVNGAVEKLFSTSKSHFFNAPLTALFESELNLAHLAQRAFENNESFSLSHVHALPPFSSFSKQVQNTNITVNFTLKAIMQNNENWLLLEIHPKTQYNEIEKQHHKKRQQEATQLLIRGVAHEIKNPLAGIRGSAQLMQMTLPNLALKSKMQQELHEYTEIMIKESDRLKQLTDAMLGKHTQEKAGLSKAETNIHEPIERVIALLQSQFQAIHFTKDYDVSLPTILLDKNRIIQVLLNIGLNAAKVLTDNDTPSPTVTFKTRIATNIILHGTTHKHAIQVSIIDNGIGIPHHIKDTLFLPMVTAQTATKDSKQNTHNTAHAQTVQAGTGLGLSIAQDIVHHHDGIIDFHSEYGNTAFHIFLPLS